MICHQSKTWVAILVPLCLYASPGLAQKKDSLIRRVSNTHAYYVGVCIFSGENLFFSENKTGPIQVSFPYSVTAPGGATTDTSFKSAPISPYSKSKSQVSLFTLEVGNPKQFFTAGVTVNFIGELNGYGFMMGYGRNLYFLQNNDNATPVPAAFFVFRPSLNLAYSPYSGFDHNNPFYLGSINNDHRQLYVLGNSIPPTYTTGGRFPKTFQAKTLDIYYSQHDWALVPKIALSNNPFKHFLHWEIELAYNMPLTEKTGILLTQDSAHPIQTVNINDRHMQVLYNSHPIRSSPYVLYGFYIGGRIGLLIPSRKFDRCL